MCLGLSNIPQQPVQNEPALNSTSAVCSRLYHAMQSLCPASHTEVLKHWGRAPVSNSVAAHENIYGFVLFCFGKTPVKKCHLPLLILSNIMGEVWVKCPFSSWTAIITSDPAAHGGSSWYQSSASETSCTSTASVMGMRQTAPFLSSSCSRLSFPASFCLLIHVLLPHIWLGAWSHFLDLIPSSCLLPALSHRG